MNCTNKMFFIGRLTKDPELKSLESGKKVCNITLAVDRSYTDKEGNKITDFIPFALWDKQAENICKISKKGSLDYLEGTLNMKTIEEDGIRKNIYSPSITSYKNLSNVKDYSDEPEKEQKEMTK